MDIYYKLPRLYVESLNEVEVMLDTKQSHYLGNVMRLKKGDEFRAFNGGTGEYVMTFAGKTAIKKQKIADVWHESKKIHLFVPPVSKDRMHFMIEKATELGIASYTPLITERTQFRKINEDKVRAWMIEAVEQSERFDIPTIHKPMDLHSALSQAKGTKMAAIERTAITQSSPIDISETSVFIGPAGGWSDQEITLLNTHCQPIDLGRAVLRSETAVTSILSIINQYLKSL